jgi:hypothetical protein
MARKALCVGINNFKNFPGSALQGCVNDVQDMKGILREFLGFTDSDIRVLTDVHTSIHERKKGVKWGDTFCGI